jgi:hypothetical protein
MEWGEAAHSSGFFLLKKLKILLMNHTGPQAK